MTQTIEDIIPLVKLAVGEKVGGQQHIFDDALQEATIAAWIRLDQGHSRQIAIRGAKQRTIDILRGNRMLGSKDEHGGRVGSPKHTLSLTIPSGDDGTEEYLFEPSDTSFLDAQDQMADREALEPALEALTERQRYIVHQTYWEGLTRQEIADELGVSHQAISNSLNKALKAMRASLSK